MTTTLTSNVAVETKSWKQWLLSRESNEIINKSHQERLFKMFNASVSNDNIEKSLKDHDELAFLFKQSFGDNKIGIFHHLTSIGGNFLVNKKDYAFIQGVEESASCFLTPDFETGYQNDQYDVHQHDRNSVICFKRPH